MGCDIHLYTEMRRTINGEAKWVNIDHFKLSPYYDGKDNAEKKYGIIRLYDTRNYRLFTILAGVRNYGDSDVVISPPKGIPADCSNMVAEEAEYWKLDGYSESYFTLKELKDFANENASSIEDSGLQGLIEKIEERKREAFSIWDNYEHPEHDENIRIVFWFDT